MHLGFELRLIATRALCTQNKKNVIGERQLKTVWSVSRFRDLGFENDHVGVVTHPGR